VHYLAGGERRGQERRPTTQLARTRLTTEGLQLDDNDRVSDVASLYALTFASLMDRDTDPRDHAARLRYLQALRDEFQCTRRGSPQYANGTLAVLIQEVIAERLYRYANVVGLDRRRQERRIGDRRNRDRRAA
jgi:hypothetical protein